MALADLTDPRAVEAALAECDRLGREAFLKKYGFGKARRHRIRWRGKLYDSKAIAAVAHGYQFPELGPLPRRPLRGGKDSVAPKLRELGFEVVESDKGEAEEEAAEAAEPESFIERLAHRLNQLAGDFEVGSLQELRVRLKGRARSPTKSLFDERTIHDDYAFHVGGRTELQFNIGLEERDDQRVVRHGVAFSLETSRSLSSIDPLIPRIQRFNDYILRFAEDVAGFRMWFFDAEGGPHDRPLAPIDDALIATGKFIVLGRWTPEREAVGDAFARRVLEDFDRLLPIYRYTESEGGSMPARPSRFRPGCPAFILEAQATIPARTVRVDLRHQLLQAVLHEVLCKEEGKDNVRIEHPLDVGVRVDAAVRRREGMSFYEVKVAPTLAACIMDALGQLIEYAYWGDEQRAVELVVVGESPVDAEGAKYLELLRTRFSLPLWYRRIDARRRTLGKRS